MKNPIPNQILAALALADPSWKPILEQGLAAVAAADPAYLESLSQSAYLPTGGRLFAAFAQPFNAVRYVLVGEGPYPREESATGVCFMDGAVQELWSAKGLSTRVNRATSLRNFIKMLLVCEGLLEVERSTGEALAAAAAHARLPANGFIQSLPELQQSLHAHGFLLLNASLVYRPDVPPLRDGRAWLPFLEVVLQALAQRPTQPLPVLVLWGKVAGLVSGLKGLEKLPAVVAEHPYNLSFIGNPVMQKLFKPLHLLHRTSGNFSAVK
ncbi:MAG: uracil-DNA glycosylase [Paucimonas sp.]|nr:uracil-DNA glycosylase [Paucimonas sp.]